MLRRPASGFLAPPDPRSIGRVLEGRHLVSGRFLFAGRLIEAPGAMLFDILPPDRAYAEALQGFGWLDDLAALGDAAAQRAAQDWTWDWIARHGDGRGPGWTAALTGRRVLRWIHHGMFLLDGRDAGQRRAFFRALTRQTRFLMRRAGAAPAGLPRIEALSGLIAAQLSLAGVTRSTGPAMAVLDRDCAALIDADGGIASRAPETLLEIFALLVWTAEALASANRAPMPAHRAAIARIAPVLRALRHADGGLARFHGGGRGVEGRIDEALALAGVPGLPTAGLAMGFARLAGGRTTLIADAAAPPGGADAATAHASTLAFELTSGRRPVVVSCGPGGAFGAEWGQAGRATASHSTLAVEGVSSSRFGSFGRAGRRRHGDLLTERAAVTQARLTRGAEGATLALAHDGWVRTHGLTHARELHLSADGRSLRGEDILGALSTADQRRLDRHLARAAGAGLPFALRFHLHPDVAAEIGADGLSVTLRLKSGEVWIFRHDGAADLSLEPSVHLEAGRLAPRATRQIVLAVALAEPAVQIDWTLAKSQDTPLAIRDLDREDLPAGG